MQFRQKLVGIRNSRRSIAYKAAMSGMVMAIYVLVMFLTQYFAFGQFQVRIATSFYALSAIYPFLIIPLSMANFLSNTLLGGLGLPDMVGGFIVGMLTSTVIYLIERWRLNDWLIAFSIVLIPGLMVPIWLSYILHLPYRALAISLCLEQIIPGVFGVLLVRQLKGKIKSTGRH